ncbi:LPS export ABC transporter periplasmic protein LptC [uncultured Shimia sp.]|uniref:LPS export ABC transporter periplasmic protein LptC n=1 Tax=uncultured Shimia sp. TaxID=573152 RepID=UPI00262776E0|nr:LPS export ABC transporter periplasmic protein LptC [uncultured Shimia sp.]
MADKGITYSRIVAFLKVLLPLVALALLSTLFLLSRGSSTSDYIPFAQLDLEQRAREQQVTSPFFSGKTSSGHLVRFAAETARPDQQDPEKSSAVDMDARIDLTGGSYITLTSNSAHIDNRTHMAKLLGDVTIVSSNGYTIETAELDAAMRELFAQTPGRVTGSGPAGDFEAGKMIIEAQQDSDEATLFFTNGVKLIYTPTK